MQQLKLFYQSHFFFYLAANAIGILIPIVIEYVEVTLWAWESPASAELDALAR